MPDGTSSTGTERVERVDLSVYGIEPLLRAIHKFTGRCFVKVDMESDRVAIVRVVAKGPGDDVATIAGELLNEVLDQTLRARIAEATEPIRRLILAQAFSGANLLHPELDTTEPRTDPSSIGVPDARPA